MNHADEQGNTALHVAAAMMDSRMAALLLSHGADRRLKNKAGETPLSTAKKAVSSMKKFAATMGLNLNSG